MSEAEQSREPQRDTAEEPRESRESQEVAGVEPVGASGTTSGEPSGDMSQERSAEPEQVADTESAGADDAAAERGDAVADRGASADPGSADAGAADVAPDSAGTSGSRDAGAKDSPGGQELAGSDSPAQAGQASPEAGAHGAADVAPKAAGADRAAVADSVTGAGSGAARADGASAGRGVAPAGAGSEREAGSSPVAKADADAPAVKAGADGASAGRGSASGGGVKGARSSGSAASAEGVKNTQNAAAKSAGSAAATGSADRSAQGAGSAGGRLLAGRYRLGGVLGRGGMGTVWRAVDETLGRTVAVKELRFPNSIDEDEKRRLITRTLREAKAIARIRNNSAVTVFDVVDEDDRPWIVMELVEGKSLAEAIREDGTLTPRRAAEVGLAILDVLRSAHREGILHRDVKPSNVLIAEDGRVVLTDFGIAQVEGDPSITSTGMLVGAPSYISPERARGHKPGPAADLWSLGGLLYASVEGCPPYDKGSAIATLTAVMTEPLDPPKNAGPLEEVIYGLLAKDPDQRLDDAGARALLTMVLHTPEAPERSADPEPDATRVTPLPPLLATPAAASDAKPKDPAADRLRGALRSVRNAAAAAKAEAAPKPKRSPERPAPRPVPERAPLTDVVPRRTLVIIAVVAALAVLSTVLVLSLGGGDDKTGQGKPKGDKTTSAGASAGGEGKDSGSGTTKGQDQTKDDGKDSGKGDEGADTSGNASGGQPSGDGQGDEPKDGDALPDGYVMVSNDRFHFTMAMPKDFKLVGIAGQNSGGKFSAGGGYPRVQVDYNASPRDDAAAAWAAAVAGVSATSSGYKHLGINTVDYNGYPTVADWQFERNENGERVRILNRGFKVDAKRGYSIMVTCKASEWRSTECETLRKTAFATFSPKD
ncbi:protein kinase [Streptomyces sp. NPDC006208]|uniref:protein kinase domain-containing protein n=1 Tax=Streptomyces sp. NPDC006208 TaxID=3156734 RepID=UPI0033BA40CD